MNIVSHFFESVKRHPSNYAFVTHKRNISFLEMEQEVKTVANWLNSKGIKKGDRVLVILPIGIKFYVTILGILSIGATAVLIDQIKDKKAVKMAFEDSNATLIITNKSLYFVRWFLFSKPIQKALKVVKKDVKNIVKLCETKSTSIALITFTSGTTGKPKRAERSHGFLNHQLITLIKEMNISNETKHLSSLYVVSLCNLATGATTIHHKKHKKPSTIKPTLVSGSPYHVDQFLRRSRLNNMNKIVIGGSIIYPAFANKLKKEQPNATILFAYGSTEVEPISLISIDDYLKNWSIDEIGIPVGKIHSDVNVKIDPFHQANNTTIGEIIVTGDNVLHNHEHHTGDLGYFKNDLLYFVGRKKYCWIENGKFKSPIQLEVATNEVYPSTTQLNIYEQTFVFTTSSGAKKRLADFIHQSPIIVKQFNYDKRHNSRINYEKLIKIIEKKSEKND